MVVLARTSAPVPRALIVGAGAAGLALAWWLDVFGRATGKPTSLTIVDAHGGAPPRKLWSFWGEVPGPARHTVDRTWHRMAFVDPSGARRTSALARRPYHTVRSEVYVAHLRAQLARSPHVDFVDGRALAIEDRGGEEGASVRLEDGRTLVGRYAFQSVFRASPRGVSTEPAPLQQHFGGWEVETARPQREADAVTLMDFSGSSDPGVIAFRYVLPFSPHRRLVEHTELSGRPRDRAHYDRHIEGYLDRHIEGPWRVVRREYGVIPMDPRPVVPQAGANVFHLGAAGGMTKPSTGYTFVRSLEQARRLAGSWYATGRPQPGTGSPWRFRAYDRIFLRVLQAHPERGPEFFSRLFRHPRFDDVLDFLDESSDPFAELRVLRRLPVAPFLRALTGLVGSRLVPAPLSPRPSVPPALSAGRSR
ncbi:MAG: lycopene cyclase family protein [Myxococcota bacterium]